MSLALVIVLALLARFFWNTREILGVLLSFLAIMFALDFSGIYLWTHDAKNMFMLVDKLHQYRDNFATFAWWVIWIMALLLVLALFRALWNWK